MLLSKGIFTDSVRVFSIPNLIDASWLKRFLAEAPSAASSQILPNIREEAAFLALFTL